VPVGSTHYLDSDRGTVTDVFSRDTRAVLTVDPGDTVLVHTLDARGYLERQRMPGELRPQMFNPRRGHCMTGPIAISGAAPGDTLAVHFASLRPDDWGWTVSGERDTNLNRQLGLMGSTPAWLLWDLDAAGSIGRCNLGFRTVLEPFLGVIGVPPSQSGEYPTRQPRAEGGGNIDCRELVAGSTLYLPVTVPGALICLGDGHAAQGNGEVGGSAIECGMTSEVTLDVVRDRSVKSIHAVAPAGWITFGFSENLNDAVAQAIGAMLDWMQARLGLGRAQTAAVASTSLDLRITQVVNDTWGVHAVLPDAFLRTHSVSVDES
jgi:acetamidase/formamidase